ncbi:MAG: AraC family transcriptional regulator [Acidobacteria bacterium]|nr:AraC family transcriptional regulator [Acidobacteriota bacterium]
MNKRLSNSSHEYTKRIDRVIDHLRDHLDRQLKLEDLAKVGCFSKFHFHRIFRAMTGETLNDFTNRLRLEKAARLLKRTRQSATEIALECGFSSSATFSRSFTKAFGTSPTQYRKSGKLKNSKICKELFPKNDYILPMTAEEKEAAFPVEIRKFPARNVAYIRVSNAFEVGRVIKAFAKMIDWLKSENIYEKGVLFGMSIDDPEVTPKHLYRYEVCFASNVPFTCPDGISRMKIPSRLYGVTRVSGDLKFVSTAWDYLLQCWLINSRYEPDNAPALEIFLSKEKALDWSHFDLELAFPVREMTAK